MTNVMSRKVLKGMMLIAALASHGGYAQEQSEADTSDIREQTEAEKTDVAQPSAEPASQPKKDKGRGGEIFRPSEEISEDFAVSFPVDI